MAECGGSGINVIKMEIESQNSIVPIPPFEKNIKSAYDREKLIIFVGGGVSSLYGCKSWEKLAKYLVDECYKKEYIDYREKEDLLKQKDNRKLISICYELLQDNKEDANKKIEEALKPDEEERKCNVYELLKKFYGNVIFVTTNADTSLSMEIPNNRIVTDGWGGKKNNLDPHEIYHIHGHVNKGGLTFTIGEYLEKYSSDDFQDFLRCLFRKEYTVLFIGYGLEEIVLLDFMFIKIGDTTEGGNLGGQQRQDSDNHDHYALMPFFSTDKNLLKHECSYLKNFNIKIVPYSIDEKGYAQLYDVIKDWSAQIIVSNLGRIDKLLV